MADTGREPIREEIARNAGLSREEMAQIVGTHDGSAIEVRITQDSSAPDGVREDALDTKIFEKIYGRRHPTPDDEIIEQEERGACRRAIASLDKRQQFILYMRFYAEMKLHEIGALLGITESRVSQILTATISALRERLKSQIMEYAD